MKFYVKKYDENGEKIEKIEHCDILEAFMANSAHNHSSKVKNSEMVDSTGKVFSRYFEFD